MVGHLLGDSGGGVVTGYLVYRNGSYLATVSEPHYSDLTVHAQHRL